MSIDRPITALLTALLLAGCATEKTPVVDDDPPGAEAPQEQVAEEPPSEEVDETYEDMVDKENLDQREAPADDEENQVPEVPENGSDIAPDADAELQPPTEATPPAPGRYSTGQIRPAGFNYVEILLMAREDLGVNGNMKAEVDGTNVILPLRGQATANGLFKASGERGDDSLTVEGTYADESLVGTASGTLDGEPFQFDFTAARAQ